MKRILSAFLLLLALPARADDDISGLSFNATTGQIQGRTRSGVTKAAVSAGMGGDVWVTATTGSFGSTNTKVRRFSVTQASTGSAISYGQSAAAGDTFQVLESGLYSMTFVDQNGGGTTMVGISVNTGGGTTNVDALTASERLGYTVAVSGQSGSCTVIARLNANDIIRAHGDGTATTKASFRITQISK